MKCSISSKKLLNILYIYVQKKQANVDESKVSIINITNLAI